MRKSLLIFLALAQIAGVPEPDTYRLDDYRAPVPDTLTGARVVHTDELAAILSKTRAILIDVLPAPRRPPDRPPGSPWMPLPHSDIPGSIWLPDTGRGALDPKTEAWFDGKLRALAAADPNEPMVFYCLSHCWMSWNAARRAVRLGLPHVVWFPDGADGWEAAGHPVKPVRPEEP